MLLIIRYLNTTLYYQNSKTFNKQEKFKLNFTSKNRSALEIQFSV